MAYRLPLEIGMEGGRIEKLEMTQKQQHFEIAARARAGLGDARSEYLGSDGRPLREEIDYSTRSARIRVDPGGAARGNERRDYGGHPMSRTVAAAMVVGLYAVTAKSWFSIRRAPIRLSGRPMAIPLAHLHHGFSTVQDQVDYLAPRSAKSDAHANFGGSPRHRQSDQAIEPDRSQRQRQCAE